jgi:hypothetical protein
LLAGRTGVDFGGICHSPVIDLLTVSAAMMAVNALCLLGRRQNSGNKKAPIKGLSLAADFTQ